MTISEMNGSPETEERETADSQPQEPIEIQEEEENEEPRTQRVSLIAAIFGALRAKQQQRSGWQPKRPPRIEPERCNSFGCSCRRCQGSNYDAADACQENQSRWRS